MVNAPSDALFDSNLPLPLRRGKVRDLYDLGDTLLIVATDRISAFDVIMPDPVPGKGKILTALSNFWFEKFASQFKNHLIATHVNDFPQSLRSFADQLRDRSILVKKTRVVPIECVARGYLAGSGWKEYQANQTICGVKLPPGLKQCEKLPEPIFTPATKADAGHDENISFDVMCTKVHPQLAAELRDRTLALYSLAADYARDKGIIIADTKFEFGHERHGDLLLIDEILTPDSSRFWPADQYQIGRDQPSFDKQFLRNWLEQQPWNKQAPAPKLPREIIEGTRERYLEALRKITGSEIQL